MGQIHGPGDLGRQRRRGGQGGRGPQGLTGLEGTLHEGQGVVAPAAQDQGEAVEHLHQIAEGPDARPVDVLEPGQPLLDPALQGERRLDEVERHPHHGIG